MQEKKGTSVYLKKTSKPQIGVSNVEESSEDSGGEDEDDQTESLEESVFSA